MAVRLRLPPLLNPAAAVRLLPNRAVDVRLRPLRVAVRLLLRRVVALPIRAAGATVDAAMVGAAARSITITASASIPWKTSTTPATVLAIRCSLAIAAAQLRLRQQLWLWHCGTVVRLCRCGSVVRLCGCC